MAAGGIVGYEPVEGRPDALNFRTADGGSMLAFGDAAAQMRANLDANPRPMVAGDNAAGSYGPPSPPAPPPPAPMGPPPPQDYGAAFTGQATQAGPPPQAPPQGQGSPPPQPGPPQPAGPTGDLGAYLAAPVRVGGSPGISREQLAAKATQGVATPTSATVGSEGGFAPNQDYLDTMGELSVDERLQHQSATDYEAGRASAEADLYRNQYAANAAKEAAAAKQAALVSDGVRKQEAALTQARYDFSTSKVDPNRVFSGKHGGLRAFATAIASGLGALGAAMGHTQNYAQGIIDNMIDRDIRAQEAEIKVKGMNADNALQDLTRKTGDMGTAMAALRVIQLDQSQRQLAAFAADSKSEQVKQNASAWQIQHEKSLNQAYEDYRIKALGNVKQSVQQEMLYPKAATGGGYRPPTDAEVARRAGIANTVQGIGTARVGLANTEADTELKRAQASKVGAEGKAAPEDKELREKVGQSTAMRDQITAVVKRHGYDVKDGKIVPGEGAGFPTRLNATGSQTLNQELAGLGIGFAGIVNGGRELGEEAKKSFIPAATDTDATIISKLQAQMDTVETSASSAKKMADPRAVQALEGRANGRGASIRAQAEAGSGAGGAAYQQE